MHEEKAPGSGAFLTLIERALMRNAALARGAPMRELRQNYCGVVGFGAVGLGADGTGFAPGAGFVGAGTPDFTL